jgi:3-oxoacyl-[acyl-carrier protein] reductase
MIVVTGASKGIGEHICNRLIDKGYEVVGLARTVKKRRYKMINCDVSSTESIEKSIKTLKKLGNISGLINAAGIASLNLTLFMTKKSIQNIIDTNLVGTIYMSKLITPLMIRNKKGFIINFSTIAVPLAMKGEAIYVASKAGIEGFTRAFAREVSGFNINVNCISPGPIKTDLTRGVDEEEINNLISQQLINKQFKLDDISNLVETIINKKYSSITGQILHVCGI